MKIRNKIEELFDSKVHRHALFCNYPGGLRFELSEGGEPLDQVLTALRKANVICNDIFCQTDSMFVYLREFFPSNRFAFRNTLRELALAGIFIPADRDIWLESVSPEDRDDEAVDECWINVAFALPKAKLQNLLWCAVATDFKCMHPNPDCLVYLVNFEQGIVVHPYDDRGMDVVGRNKPLLEKLYRKHEEFLLNYDRDIIDRTFAISAASLGAIDELHLKNGV
ncbi:MAG: DUF3885 domain-containing protein [Undibacterium sp.]|nr:DUF3885 domain-containing protein [Undibacterium sp.]